ncbi:MAG TPA: hypothetical protein VFM46_10110, partial [Pseudomonadales bacterium]|nr:hypothetical protein [Pseudomonadales bacterium]
KHNQCSNNGYAAGNSLSGGIYAIADGMTCIESNTIIGYQGDSAGGITLNATTTPTTKTKIRLNRILSSAKYGLFAGTNVALTDITENEIRNSTAEDIFVSLNGGSASVGGLRIEANDITRTGADARSIYMDLQASTLKNVVTRNRIKGTGTGTSASIGLEIRLPASDVDVFDNEFDSLYYGVKIGGYISGGRLFTKIYERNRFSNINTAWGLSSTGSTEVVPLVANTYNNVTNKTAANASIGGNSCGYVCDKQGDGLTIYGVTASPAAGTWAIGDRAVRVPVVGQPKSWSVTSAGSPGTWTSEGNL